MPKTGDSFIVSLTPSQLAWGTYRNPTNRAPIQGEGYIAIPRNYAVAYKIYNSKNWFTGLGYNEFIATASDGFINEELLLAQGNTEAGDPYAKNFAIKGDLKRLGAWFAYAGASAGSKVKVTFTSPTEVYLEII